MPSAIVVGGGIAGLVMARDLVLGGFEVTLLEASDHLGGKIARHTVAGLVLDAGAESFATRHDTVAHLARQLGLGSDIARPNPKGAWLQTAEGRAYPLPRTGILGIPGTPLAADVIEVVGFWAALRGQLDELMLGFVGSKERSLGRLVRRRMGRRVLEQLVAPVTLGIHSRHPDELDVDVVAPGLRAAMLDTGSLAHAVRELRDAAPAGTAVSGIVGGMFGLVEALARDLERFGVTVRLESPVTAVEASLVTLLDGQLLEADQVVLAAPLATPLATMGPSDRTPAIVLATLVVDAPSWMAPRVVPACSWRAGPPTPHSEPRPSPTRPPSGTGSQSERRRIATCSDSPTTGQQRHGSATPSCAARPCAMPVSCSGLPWSRPPSSRSRGWSGALHRADPSQSTG